MMGMGYYEERREPTPVEKCRGLLVELRREQKKEFPSVERLTQLTKQIHAFPAREIMQAFDYLIDTQGW